MYVKCQNNQYDDCGRFTGRRRRRRRRRRKRRRHVMMYNTKRSPWHTHIKDPVVPVTVSEFSGSWKYQNNPACTKSVWVFGMLKLDASGHAKDHFDTWEGSRGSTSRWHCLTTPNTTLNRTQAPWETYLHSWSHVSMSRILKNVLFTTFSFKSVRSNFAKSQSHTASMINTDRTLPFVLTM